MKTERIIWGIVLLFLGGILLLQNFNVINFEWSVIWRFWPVILILIGANMLFSNSRSAAGGVVTVLITVIVLGFIGYKGINNNEADMDSWITDDNPAREQGDTQKTTVFSEPYIAGTRNAILNIEGGATSFILRDTASELFTAHVKKHIGNYSVFKFSTDTTETVDFKMTGEAKWDMKKSGSNQVVMTLNPEPVWDINLETGAGKTNFDLTKYKIRKMKLEGGVAKFDIKLGSLYKTTVVDVESGVSKITISIPESAGCEIKTESGLSSLDFKGFTKLSDNSFQTPNFASAQQKITINMEGGLSKFKVERY